MSNAVTTGNVWSNNIWSNKNKGMRCIVSNITKTTVKNGKPKYTTNNKGVFQAMLWYNKFKSDEMANATIKIFGILHKVLEPLNISSNNVEHIIRTLRSFLEGFSLLVNNNSFGNPISIKESFDLSLDIIINGIKSLEGVK